jgi:TonB family protein
MPLGGFVYLMEEYFENGRCCGYFTGAISFLATWWYCAETYGFLWGFGFGWVPSAIIGLIVFVITILVWGIVLYGGIILAVFYFSGCNEVKNIPQENVPILLDKGKPVENDAELQKEMIRIPSGRVSMLVDIDQNGTVTQCKTLISSNSLIIDKKACELVRNYRYSSSSNNENINQSFTVKETLEWGNKN